MEKQFVPYVLALELKELGFNEKCFKSYRQQIKYEWYDLRSSKNITFNENEKIILSNGKIDSYEKYLCDAPLWQQAFDWFRENHKLNSFIYTPIDKINYCFEIKNILEFINDGDLSEMQSGIKYTYEEARLECLKKLINIIK